MKGSGYGLLREFPFRLGVPRHSYAKWALFVVLSLLFSPPIYGHRCPIVDKGLCSTVPLERLCCVVCGRCLFSLMIVEVGYTSDDHWLTMGEIPFEGNWETSA